MPRILEVPGTRKTVWARVRAGEESPFMGHIAAAHLEYRLPDGRVLFADASFRIGESAAVALVGADGAGAALLRVIAGELAPHGGSVQVSGGLGVMPRLAGAVRDDATVRDLLAS